MQLLFLYAAVLGIILRPGSGALIASSRVTSCTNDGSTDPVEAGLRCTKKMVVSISIAGGQVRFSFGVLTGSFATYFISPDYLLFLTMLKLNGTESIEAVNINSAEVDGKQQQLEIPFRISIGKSPVLVLYPVVYKRVFFFFFLRCVLPHYHAPAQTVNNQPYEIVRYVSGGPFATGCVDADNAANPTCGWYLSDEGNLVPHSQVKLKEKNL
jgi:hypothetical protein